MLFAYVATREELETYAAELFAMVSEGRVKVHVHGVYPLAEAERAHVDLEGRRTRGKLLLKCD